MGWGDGVYSKIGPRYDSIWFNYIEVSPGILGDLWLNESLTSRPRVKSAMKCRLHHCVTRLQETEQEGSDEEYDGGMHVSLGFRRRTGSKIWKYVDWFPDRSIDPSPCRNLGPSKRFVLSCGVRKLNTFLSSLLSECQILFARWVKLEFFAPS